MKYLLLFFVIFSSCQKPKPTPQLQIPVSTSTAITADVPLYFDYVGHVIPLNTINIVPQVQGYLTNYYVREGQEVRAGDLIATIDDRPYKAQLAKAEAILSQNVASLKLSEETAQRYSKLLKDQFVSQLNFDTYITDVVSNESLINQR